MAWATYVIGKGLRERNPPYHSAYVFGAVLNAVNTAGWYSPLDIWDPTEAFDLSTITKNHEVVVALVNVTTDGPYSLTCNFQWYRDRDNALLFEHTGSMSFGYAAEQSYMCYIGWTDNEINENGNYHVTIRVRGTYSFSYTLNFSVSGIPAVVPPPVIPGNPMDAIFSLVWDIRERFNTAAETVGGWIWPFCLLSTPLYHLRSACWQLLTPIANFGDWVSNVATKVSNILTYLDIMHLFQTWVTYAENAWNWVLNAWQNILSVVLQWWYATIPTIQGWIAIATQGLPGLLVAWNNFWTVTLPTLISSAGLAQWWKSRLLDISTLLNSAFTTRQSLWSGWQELRDQVIEFFTDPVEFIWEKFTDWFLGPEVKQ